MQGAEHIHPSIHTIVICSCSAPFSHSSSKRGTFVAVALPVQTPDTLSRWYIVIGACKSSEESQQSAASEHCFEACSVTCRGEGAAHGEGAKGVDAMD